MACGQDCTATVKLHLVNEFGKGAGSVKVDEFIYGGGEGKDFSARFVGGEAAGIPAGRYHARVEAGDIGVRDWINVSCPKTFAVLGGSSMIFDFAPGHSVTLRGTISNLPLRAHPPIWLEAMDIYHSGPVYRDTAELGKDGSFAIPLPGLGEYMILVLDDSGPLFYRTVRVDKVETSLAIDLRSARP